MPQPDRARRTTRLLLGPVAAGVAALVAVPLSAAPAAAETADQAFAAGAGEEVQVRSGQAREENAALAELAANAEKAAAKIVENAWQLPIAAGAYQLTATFGQCSGLWSHCHTGLDFAAPEGTEIKALANGVVSDTGWAGAYGNRTIITLDDGTDIWYCHQSQFGAKEGQPVVGGQTIGFVGTTGNSTGPHLHLEVRPGGGDAVDPERALAVRGTAP